jgi:hypothetical protein
MGHLEYVPWSRVLAFPSGAIHHGRAFFRGGADIYLSNVEGMTEHGMANQVFLWKRVVEGGGSPVASIIMIPISVLFSTAVQR